MRVIYGLYRGNDSILTCETVVRLRNIVSCRETVISITGNDSSPPGNGKSMYTITFYLEELAYVRFICYLQILYLQPMPPGICNIPTIY